MFRQFFVVISSALAATIIPIHFNEHNRMLVSNVTVEGGGITNTSLSVEVCFARGTRGVFQPHRFHEFRELVSSRNILLGDDASLAPGIDSQIGYYRNIIYWGIVPDSAILSEYHSITLLKNETSRSGILIMNDSEAGHFNRSCAPDSIAHMQLDADEFFTRMNIRYSLQLPSGDEIVETNLNRTMISSDCIYMLTLPWTLGDEILRVLDASGAIRSRESETISNCAHGSLIGLLPQIKLSDLRSMTQIVFFPEDYMEFNQETNECRLRIRIATGDDSPLVINPFLL